MLHDQAALRRVRRAAGAGRWRLSWRQGRARARSVSVLTVGHVAPTHQHLHSRHTVADIWASSDSEQKWDSQCSDYHGIMSSVKDKIHET